MIVGLRLLLVDPDRRPVEALSARGFSVRTAARATDALVEYGGVAPDALPPANNFPKLGL